MSNEAVFATFFLWRDQWSRTSQFSNEIKLLPYCHIKRISMLPPKITDSISCIQDFISGSHFRLGGKTLSTAKYFQVPNEKASKSWVPDPNCREHVLDTTGTKSSDPTTFYISSATSPLSNHAHPSLPLFLGLYCAPKAFNSIFGH